MKQYIICSHCFFYNLYENVVILFKLILQNFYFSLLFILSAAVPFTDCIIIFIIN